MTTISGAIDYHSTLFDMEDMDEEPENSEQEDYSTAKKPDRQPAYHGKPAEEDNMLQAYFTEIQNYRLLSREEQKELAIRFQEKGDEEAACKMITSSLRLVAKIAYGFKKFWPGNLLDLIQEGNLGLIQAVKKFDPYRKTKFSYYASYWIKAYILKYIINNVKLVKIGTTQTQRKLFYRLGKERDKLIAEGFVPEPGLLAERLDVSERDIVEMGMRLSGKDLSLNAPLADDSSETLACRLPDAGMPADKQVSMNQERRLLLHEIREFRKTLSGREADIFDNRIMADRGTTLKVLGERYHLSRERIRQIEKAVLGKFKKRLEANIPEFNEYGSELLGA